MFKRKNKAAKAAGSAKKQVLLPSVISADMHVIGNIVSIDGALDIDGQIDGNIRCHTVSLRENGRVRGDIVADNIYIYGRVEGLVKGHQVTLYSTANVVGTIMHEALSVEDGAFVDGQFKRTDRLSDEELQAKRLANITTVYTNDNDNDEPPSEAELIILKNLQLIS